MFFSSMSGTRGTLNKIIYIIIDMVLYKFRMQPMLKNSVLLLKRAWTLLFNLDTPRLPHLKIADKEELFLTISLYLFILKSKAELDQLKEGLQFLGVGYLMSRLKDTMKPLFLSLC